MKLFNYRILFFTLFTLLLVTGCLKDTNNRVADISNDASILRAYIQSSTYSPNASKANFTIDHVNNTIYNKDSLPYGTQIDSLFIGFTFASSLGYVMNDTISESNYFNTAVTSKAYNFNDTVKIKNLATDGKSTKEYTMEIRVHQVETYLHVWSNLNASIASTATDNQKAILLRDKFYYYVGHPTSNSLFTSENAVSWAETTPVGLPLNAGLKNMVVLGDTVAFLLHNGNEIYQSTDGVTWTQSVITGDANYNYVALLFPFKDKLWAIAQHKTNTTEVKVASSDDGITWIFPGNKVFTDNFPVRDFAVTTFTPTLERSKVVVAGGISPSGKRLNTIWSAENLRVDTLNWLDLQNPKSNMLANSHASAAYYGSKLLLFGGSSNTLTIDTTQLRQSINQGLNWISPDTTINRLPADYIPRINASLINHAKDRSLYVIGGKSASGTLSDVWKIKVNFYSFADYNPLNSKY